MTFDVFQQVFGLSFIAGAVNDDKGDQKTLQGQLQSQINHALPLVGEGWQLVWGPVVWKHDSDDTDSGPDNSWYIAYHPCLKYEDNTTHPTYVISIAGTPRSSLYVWALENFLVNSVTDFNAWVAGGIQNYPFPSLGILPGGAYIATGTVTTTHLLLTTATPDCAASPSTTLLDFVKNVDQSVSPRFISTGHSLGGALSPSLALALVKAGVIPGNNTLTYPLAGPSPGDVGFTKLFVKTFPSRKSPVARSYQGWNLNLVNTLDPVPQAWAIDESLSQKQNLFNIPGLYGRPILPDVQFTVWLGAIWSSTSGVQYEPLPSQYFSGVTPSSAPTSLPDFLKDVVREHIQAYIDEVKVPIPSLEASATLSQGLVLKTEREKRYNFPLIVDFEWPLDHPEEARQVQEKVQASAQAQAILGKYSVAGVSTVSRVGRGLTGTLTGGLI